MKAWSWVVSSSVSIDAIFWAASPVLRLWFQMASMERAVNFFGSNAEKTERDSTRARMRAVPRRRTASAGWLTRPLNPKKAELTSWSILAVIPGSSAIIEAMVWVEQLMSCRASMRVK